MSFVAVLYIFTSRRSSLSTQKLNFASFSNIPDFHRMVVIVKKTSFERLKPRVMNYRDYKSFENKLIQKKLLYELSNATLEKNADDFKEFIEICQKL